MRSNGHELIENGISFCRKQFEGKGSIGSWGNLRNVQLAAYGLAVLQQRRELLRVDVGGAKDDELLLVVLLLDAPAGPDAILGGLGEQLRLDLDDAAANDRCHQSPVQLLLPAGTKSRLPPSQSALELEPDGAVVFGHNALFGFRWPDKGTVEMPEKDFPVPWHKINPMRLFSKSSDGTETEGNRSDTDAASRPDSDDAMDTSESSTSTPPENSPPSQRSGLLGLLKKRRGCSLEDDNALERKKRKTNGRTEPTIQ
ncbi:hypothetical protein NLG97_g220 [Lecanicillium saksenae]|uniref:Uncharacterized protein n=1 Tax=Lecanicillium saksenae TaxID=468837 RepID=A0ACC1R9V1_9HYPO|nr:hypothetical protein NLG97_g220 [Lecanicillium saksenae]